MIPRSALMLGLAGLLPFFWGAATTLSVGLADMAVGLLGPRLVGPSILITYGVVILSFMSGVLWGFVAQTPPHLSDKDIAGVDRTPAWRGYAASVCPALWAFFMVSGPTGEALSALLAGFVALFALDVQFSLWGLAPAWWLRLRVMLTAGVVGCLAIGLWGGV